MAILNLKTIKCSADKIAFLALLVLTLVIAYFMVESRSNKPLKAGNKTIAQIKNNGVASYFSNQPLQQYYLLKNSKGRVLGYTMDIFEIPASTANSDIRVKSFLYIRNRYAQQQIVFFQGSNNIDLFMWHYQSSGITGKKNIDIALDETQTLTVSATDNRSKQAKFKLKSAAIPEFFIDLVLQQMLISEYKKIVIDIIQSDGQVTPLLITKTTQDPTGSNKDSVYIFQLRLLDSSGFTEAVLMNQQGVILKKILPRERITLEPADVNTILKYFPKQAQYILQNKEIMEQN